MSVHRLLQRGFAQLYQYELPKNEPNTELQSTLQDAAGSGQLKDTDFYEEYAEAVLMAESGKDLHYKIKGASVLANSQA